MRARNVVLGLVLVAVAGGGVGGYLHLTRLDRALERAAAAESHATDDRAWDVLFEHADDPRVQRLYRDRIGALAARPASALGRRGLDRALGLLRQPVSIAEDDETLAGDLALLHAKLGVDEADIRARIAPLLADFDTSPLVNEALLDHAAAFAAARAAWELYDRQHLTALLVAITARGIAADTRAIAAAAALLVHGVSFTDDSRHAAALGILDGAAGEAALSQALATSLRVAEGRRKPLHPVTFDVVADLLLKRLPEPGEPYAKALAYHCAAIMAYACTELAAGLGEDAPRRLRALAEADDDADRAAYLARLAGRVEALRAGTLDVAGELIEAVARTLTLRAAWDANRLVPSRIELVLTPSRLRARAATALAGMDEAVLARLRVFFRGSGNRALVAVAARALASAEPERFATLLIGEIDTFAPLARAHLAGQAIDREAYFHSGDRVAEGLRAIDGAASLEVFTGPLFQALSLAEPAYSQYASKALRRRLDRDQFSDGLFRFLAQRDRFGVAEVDVYRGALTSYAGVSAAIERNLGALLDAAGGMPERVYWIHKVIGLQALAAVGEISALAVVEKYRADTGAYVSTGLRTVAGITEDIVEQRPFRDLAELTISEIKSRN